MAGRVIWQGWPKKDGSVCLTLYDRRQQVTRLSAYYQKFIRQELLDPARFIDGVEELAARVSFFGLLQVFCRSFLFSLSNVLQIVAFSEFCVHHEQIGSNSVRMSPPSPPLHKMLTALITFFKILSPSTTTPPLTV